MEVALTQDPDLRRVMDSGIKAVKLAVELGADVNAADANGDTALHLAAFHGFESVVRFLVSRGAGLDAENHRGETPLERALSPRAPARLTRSLTDYTDTSTADLLLAPRRDGVARGGGTVGSGRPPESRCVLPDPRRELRVDERPAAGVGVGESRPFQPAQRCLDTSPPTAPVSRSPRRRVGGTAGRRRPPKPVPSRAEWP